MSKFDFLDKFNKPQPLDSDAAHLRDLADELGGNLVSTECGRYLELTTRYGAGFLHGVRSLETVLAQPGVDLAHFDVNAAPNLRSLEDFVFIDAETTGLSAASGTVAFLVGVGFVADNCLTVTQFFLPDFPDEPAQLEAIAEIAGDRRHVVSFNGKCFDLPLLETRYAMQRLKSPFVGMFHIDLLHCCRRFWRGRFDDSTLQTLERELLNLHRQDDTPGWMIPSLYFDYLRSGRAGPLAGVLLHNRLDIVTLLFLVDAVRNYLQNAAAQDYYSAEDALRISRFLMRRGDLALAHEAARRQSVGATETETDTALALHLFSLQKKLGQFDDALSTLERLSLQAGELRLRVLDESAKLLEHRLRNYERASQLVLQALEYLDSPLAEIPYDRVLFWNETLQKRRARLLQRLR